MADSRSIRDLARPMLSLDRQRNILVGRNEMTNIQSMMGAAVWVMIALSLAFEALRPVVIA